MPADTPPQGAQPSANIFAGRDRVLLYTRGMEIDPVQGVSLALKALRLAGPGAGPGRVMEEMFHILHNNDVMPDVRDAQGRLIASAPPMNRSIVVADDMEQLSLSGAIAHFFRSRFAPPGGGEKK